MITRRQFNLSALAMVGMAATRGLMAGAPAAKAETMSKVTAVDCHAHVFHRGLAVVDPKKDLATLNDLDKAGIVGIRMNLASASQLPDVSQGAWKELVAECVRLHWHVEIYDNANRLENTMAPLLKAGANVVVDHFGRPDPKIGVDDPGFRFLVGAAYSRKVWVKLSAPYRSSLETAAAAAPMLLKHFGPERLVWGSDWPFTNFEKNTRYPEMRALLDKWVPDAKQREMILAETPSKLYRF